MSKLEELLESEEGKQELESYFSKQVAERGYTLVPLSLYFKDGKAKLEIGLAKGKKIHDKRQTMKERDAKRDIERAFKQHQRR